MLTLGQKTFFYPLIYQFYGTHHFYFVLGPLLFAVYCSPVPVVIVSRGVQFHQYANDTQLRVAMSSDNTSDGLVCIRCVYC